MGVRKLLRTQWIAAGVGVTLALLVYMGGVWGYQTLIHETRARVLGARISPESHRDQPRPLAYAPDVFLPAATDGKAPVFYSVPTTLPVVFLTIDDGFYRDPAAAKAMQDARVPAALFLVDRYVKAAPQYFGELSRHTGSSIENHTLDHAELTTLNYDEQKREICSTADMFAKIYGYRPQLLRPPYGSYNDDTKRAAAACGMRAVVHWRALVADGQMQYQVGDRLRPGDIVLMHFTPNFVQDLHAFTQASRDAGLTPQPLDAWLAN